MKIFAGTESDKREEQGQVVEEYCRGGEHGRVAAGKQVEDGRNSRTYGKPKCQNHINN